MHPLSALLDYKLAEAILHEAGPQYFTHAKAAFWIVVLSHSAGIGIWMAKQKRRKGEIAGLDILEEPLPEPEPRPEW